MATAFTRDYNQFNPDVSLGPNTWVLNSAGVNPGGGGGGTTTATTYSFDAVQNTGMVVDTTTTPGNTQVDFSIDVRTLTPLT